MNIEELKKAAASPADNFYSTEEMDKFFEERSKPTFKNFCLDVRAWCYRTIDNIKYFPKDIKHAYQRVRYGISDQDVWSLHWHLSNVIIRGVKHLQKYKMGFPTSFSHNNEGVQICSDEEAIKKWNEVLSDIQYTFEIAQLYSNMEVLMPETEADRVRDQEFVDGLKKRRDIDTRVLSVEEIARFKKGFALFQEYFFSLWD